MKHFTDDFVTYGQITGYEKLKGLVCRIFG